MFLLNDFFILKIVNFKYTEKVINMEDMFNRCNSLSYFFNNFNTEML